jgi:hypothetical protein
MPRQRILNNRFSVPVKSPATVKELSELARNAVDVSTRLRNLIKKAQTDIAANKAENQRRTLGLPPSSVQSVTAAFDTAHKEWKRSYLDHSEPDRVKLQIELKALTDAAKRTRGLFENDREYLESLTLGDPRKRQLIEELREMSAPALLALAQRAAESNDRVLGAALVKVVGAMDSPNRPFSPNELAQALVDKDLVEAEEAVRAITQTALHASNDLTELKTGQRSGLTTIEAALLNPGAGDGRPENMRPKSPETSTDEEAA